MFTRSLLAGSLCAVHLYASSALGATSPDEARQTALTMPDFNPYVFTDTHTKPVAPYTSCDVKTVGYSYDDRFLGQLNETLGSMKSWLVQWQLFDPSLVEQYYEQNGVPEEQWDMGISDNFQEIFAIDSIYKAGTKDGLAFLQADPINVEIAVVAYLKHREALRIMLNEMSFKDMENLFGKNLDNYENSVSKMKIRQEELSKGPCEYKPDGP